MQTKFNEARNANEALMQANILRKASRLFTIGYAYELSSLQPDVYLIRTPKGDWYAVDVRYQICSCEGFKLHGDCSHRIAMSLEIERENALVKEAEEAENDEGIDSSNGGGWNW